MIWKELPSLLCKRNGQRRQFQSQREVIRAGQIARWLGSPIPCFGLCVEGLPVARLRRGFESLKNR